MLKLNHAAAMGTAFAVRGLNCWARGAFWEKCRPIASQKRDSKLTAMHGQAALSWVSMA
jgi:hypothetical protein